MTGSAIVTEIVNILSAGLQGLGTALGGGVNNYVTALAFTGTGSDQALSVFFTLIIVFAGVALAVGLTRHIFAWLSSLGGSN